MPGICIPERDEDAIYDNWRQAQDDDAAETVLALAECDIRDADWWKDKLGGLSIADDAASALARCMTNLDAACRGCPISRDAITTALSNLQQRARADARDEEKNP